MKNERAFAWIRTILLSFSAILQSACAPGPQVTVSPPLSDDADAPYDKILVVALFDSFDSRRYLEEEIVKRLQALGVDAVRSTSMMDTRTPVVAQTFIDMVKEVGADAVTLTQLTGARAESKEEDAGRPQASYNYWPTYYYNVFEVQVTEYVEPPRITVDWSLVLATQVFSVKTREPVWAIDASSQFTEIEEDGLDYNIYVNEAEAIVRHMQRDGLIVPK